MNFIKYCTLFLLLGFGTAVLAQKSIPSVKVQTLKGETVDIQEYTNQGKPVVLSFWATWCAPCKKELDAIADIYAGWQADYGVELIAISIDNQHALPKVGPMVESKGWAYTILSDASQQLRSALNFQAIPQTFLVDESGIIIYEHTGYVPGDEYKLEEKIKEAVRK